MLCTNQERSSKSIILKVCTASKISKSPAISWGKSNEKRALKAFEDSMTDVHGGCNVEVTALRLHKKYHFLGASADGLGSCRCHGDFLVEIKCPYSLKDKQTIEDCLPDKRFCIDETLQLKKTHRYMTQIQMQIMTSRDAFSLFGCHNSVVQLKFLMMRAFVKILKSC